MGVAPVLDLLTYHPENAIAICLHPNISDVLEYKISALTKKYSVSIVENTKAFNLLSPKENCFAIGIFKKYTNILLKNHNHVVLVNPSNTGNLGTIMRSCLGFDIKDIAIISPAVDAFDPKCIRASMGAFFQTRFQYFNSFDDYKKSFQKHYFYPFMLKAKETLQTLKNIKKPYALIFGNEGSGLSDAFLEIGTPLFIEHTHNIDSLNIQTAVSLACYEFTKEEKLK